MRLAQSIHGGGGGARFPGEKLPSPSIAFSHLFSPCNAFQEWRQALPLVQARAAIDAANARVVEVKRVVGALEARPVRGEGELLAERRARVAAEEAQRAMEGEMQKLRREVAATPALRAREREVRSFHPLPSPSLAF